MIRASQGNVVDAIEPSAVKRALPSARGELAAGAALPVCFELPLRVYYEDTDAGGIVYYANWLRFFERARTDWLRSLGAVHTQMGREHGLAFVVRELSVDYRRPAHLDDELIVDVRLAEARGASWLLWQSARRRGEDDPLVAALVRIAAVRRDDGRPAGIPRWLQQSLAGQARHNTPSAADSPQSQAASRGPAS
ncbi:MAG: tol-pal system-associated acyl-CoA thioesterase [Burkholderiaceae bacterium]